MYVRKSTFVYFPCVLVMLNMRQCDWFLFQLHWVFRCSMLAVNKIINDFICLGMDTFVNVYFSTYVDAYSCCFAI
jgi:hypothetical protein